MQRNYELFRGFTEIMPAFHISVIFCCVHHETTRAHNVLQVLDKSDCHVAFEETTDSVCLARMFLSKIHICSLGRNYFGSFYFLYYAVYYLKLYFSSNYVI